MAYTTIDDPSAYFHIQLYTGNSNTAQTITNNANAGDFKADWLWIKNRDDVEQHHLMDSNRGANKFMHSNSTDDERDGSYNGGHNDINAFGSNGFTITSSGSNDELNFGSRLYVTWQWKCNGGTTTSQTGSDIDSVTQANTTSKFAIITYTGASNADSDSDNNSGAYWRVKHGLGSTPKLAIFKKRSSAAGWYVWHHKLGGTQDQKTVQFQSTNGVATESDILFGNTDWSSTEFEIGGWDVVNRDGTTYVSYMFDEVQGYSKFGSYKGNGNADGPFIYTGFKPKYFVLKNITASSGSGGQHWQISDTGRHPDNPLDLTLFVEDNASEGGTWSIKDFLSNGVKIRGSNYAMNYSGDTYIYMAFAEHPFVSSKGIPTTAR